MRTVGSYPTKTTTAKGTVIEWVWSNPHCLLRFDEKADNGEVRHWVVETQAPANMIDAGWSKNSFKPGEEVTVEIRPAKSGKFVGILNKVVFADGRVLSTERNTQEPISLENPRQESRLARHCSPIGRHSIEQALLYAQPIS
jgi:Family of unknown function (DUF6152)